MYIWKTIADEHRVILAIRFGRMTPTPMVSAIAVAPINLRPEYPAEQFPAPFEGKPATDYIYDWAAYIGPSWDPDAFASDAARDAAINLAASHYGQKVRAEIGFALFPSLPQEKWRS